MAPRGSCNPTRVTQSSSALRTSYPDDAGLAAMPIRSRQTFPFCVGKKERKEHSADHPSVSFTFSLVSLLSSDRHFSRSGESQTEKVNSPLPGSEELPCSAQPPLSPPRCARSCHVAFCFLYCVSFLSLQNHSTDRSVDSFIFSCRH